MGDSASRYVMNTGIWTGVSTALRREVIMLFPTGKEYNFYESHQETFANRIQIVYNIF